METADRNKTLTRVERKALRALSSLPEHRQMAEVLREELHRSLVHLQNELDALAPNDEGQ